MQRELSFLLSSKPWDLDEQRSVMKQFDIDYMGDEADGASPSSDYGF